jgi:hypothetical protein
VIHLESSIWHAVKLTFFLARLEREPKRGEGSGYGLRASRAEGRK